MACFLFCVLAASSLAAQPSQPAGKGNPPAKGKPAGKEAEAARKSGGAQKTAAPAVALQPVHHELKVSIDPATHHIRGRDQILIPDPLLSGKQELVLRLHTDLQLSANGTGLTVVKVGEPSPLSGGSAPFQEYKLTPDSGTWPSRLDLSFEGTIHHPLVQEEEEYARSFSRTPGLIDTQGVVLSRASRWFPDLVKGVGDGLVTFQLDASLPAGWDVVSQGTRERHDLQEAGGESRRIVRWACTHPMDDLYLIAAQFTEYSRPAGSATAQAFLRTPDPNLANKYLEVTAQYLEMYRKLLGPYPYQKFALVENFWETGYGMPSFTLLGSKIIRFPFILHSSYPHEILHNWWGNSVFVDYDKGNWCEGLTAYLADHLVKEGKGQGEEYRRDTLKRYLDYVQGGNEIALVDFRERHSSASEAVGYGKSLMLWHMLRRKIGDDKFVLGLQRFYRNFRFRRASFDDLAQVFTDTAGSDLKPFFRQWVERTGAPEIVIEDLLASGSLDSGYQIDVRLAQKQTEEPFAIDVPIAIQLKDESVARVFTFSMTKRVETFKFNVDRPPFLAQVDPQFDLFRRLDRSEVPPTAGELFGAQEVTIVVPSDAGQVSPAAWRTVADGWARGDGVRVVSDADIESLPPKGPVWLLGTQNRFVSSVQEDLGQLGVVLDRGTLRVGPRALSQSDHSFLFVVRPEARPNEVVGWIGGLRPAALPGLARKLPHYGKYSYLAFEGDEPTNVLKGQWVVTDSPLIDDMRIGREKEVPIEFPRREPLARLEAVFDGAAMRKHIEFLTAPEREGRGAGTAGLDQSAEYIAEAFRAAGLQPAGEEGTFFQAWTEPGGPGGREITLRNVVGVLPGKRADWSEQSVVLGAHYDHLGRGWPDVRAGHEGKIHPGADDNASGVSVLLEVARLLGTQLEPPRAVVFVAFSGEEWGLKGSGHYVREMKTWPASKARAMMNLDAVGRLEGKKLMVLGGGTATEWVHIARGVGFTTGVESQTVMDDPGGSDQVSFHAVGVPAVQLFSGPNEDYHRPTDTVEKIDFPGLVKVATFVRESLVYLCEREEPLTSTLTKKTPGAPKESTPPKSGRRVSLGTVPDFAHQGPGVKITSVLPGSSAEKAGLKGGDQIIAIDGAEVKDLRAYSQILAKHVPGDAIEIEVLRDGKSTKTKAVLVAR